MGLEQERGRENTCFPVEEGLGKPWVSQGFLSRHSRKLSRQAVQERLYTCVMNKRYWLRGALVVLALYVLIGAGLAFYELSFYPHYEFAGLGTMLYFIGPGLFIFGIDGYEAFISLAATIVLYFAIGALFGLLYQKIRYRWVGRV